MILAKMIPEMSLGGERVQRDLPTVCLSKESLSEEPRCPCLGNGASLSLPGHDIPSSSGPTVFFLESLEKVFSCLPQTPASSVLSSSGPRMQALMFSLSVLWTLPCSSGPGPGLLADLSSPVPPLGPLVYCLLECVSEFIKSYGRRGEHPLAGCALFIVLQLPKHLKCLHMQRNTCYIHLKGEERYTFLSLKHEPLGPFLELLGA
uniref:Uncharacterized protein n=1 Tax=Myotis myotis TaxID=51298 RepID=A0A7J7QUH1_MYOMY|nr:hypothetical protein mMyoMyo1_011563 [Myotis myotis]